MVASLSNPKPPLAFKTRKAIFYPFTGMVTRPVGVTVRFQDQAGALHEPDHLNGKLFIDYLSHVKRLAIAGRLKKIEAGKI